MSGKYGSPPQFAWNIFAEPQNSCGPVFHLRWTMIWFVPRDDVAFLVFFEKKKDLTDREFINNPDVHLLLKDVVELDILFFLSLVKKKKPFLAETTAFDRKQSKGR